MVKNTIESLEKKIKKSMLQHPAYNYKNDYFLDVAQSVWEIQW